jgi:hypothetical protein
MTTQDSDAPRAVVIEPITPPRVVVVDPDAPSYQETITYFADNRESAPRTVDSAGRPAWNTRRVALLRVSGAIIRERPEIVARILSGVLVVRTEMSASTDTLNYTISHPSFPWNDDLYPPEYRAIIYYKTHDHLPGEIDRVEYQPV